MPFGLTMGTERATALQTAIENELINRGYSAEPDAVMAEYITIMVINNKTQEEITSELEDLIGSDYDKSFTDWLFVEAANGVPADGGAAAPASSTPSQPTPATTITAAPEAPQPIPTVEGRRSQGPGIYQAAINQALPSSSPSAQKRTASARSPSPNGRDPPKVARRADVPTGPRAMYRDGHGPNNNQGGGRSLLDRMSGRPQRQHGGRAHDEIQARIDSITNGGMGPGSMGIPPQVMQGGIPPGMDMSAANPMMLQEMMRNQMALMAQMASSMGILAPGMMPPGQGQFPFQGQEMMQNGMGGHLGGPPGAGRGRGGIQGRGRGGHVNGAPRQDGVQSPAQNIVAPTPVVPPAQAAAAATRPGFIPPERPQTPTLCIFGVKCTNATCRFSHPSPVATAQSGVVLSSEPCENGIKCADADCVKGHVSPAVKNGAPAVPATPSKASPAPSTNTPDRFATPCRFGSGCTRASCPFQHPEGRVLPTTFYRGLSGDQVVNVKAPETGSIGQPSHNRSMTFNAGAGAKPAATESAYERQMREIEERKRQIAELEKKAAAKKANGSSTNGSGTPDGKPVEATA